METRLREFRQRKGLTGEQFARIIGIDPATLSNIENPNSKRNSPITNKIIKAIYEKFGVRYDELYRYDTKKYTPFIYENGELGKIFESAKAFDRKIDALVSLYPFLSAPVRILKSAVNISAISRENITITILGQDGSGKSRLINNLCGKTLLPESWDNPNVCTVHVRGGKAPNPNHQYYIFKNYLPRTTGTEEHIVDKFNKGYKKDIENFDAEKVSDKEYFNRFIESYGGIDVFSAFALENGSRCNGMEYTAVIYDDAEILAYADIIEIPPAKTNKTESADSTHYDKSLINESICIYCSKVSDFLSDRDFEQLDAAGLMYHPPVQLLLYASGYDLFSDDFKSVDERIMKGYSLFGKRVRAKSSFYSDEWHKTVSCAQSLDINEKLGHAVDECASFVQKSNESHRRLYIDIVTRMNKLTEEDHMLVNNVFDKNIELLHKIKKAAKQNELKDFLLNSSRNDKKILAIHTGMLNANNFSFKYNMFKSKQDIFESKYYNDDDPEPNLRSAIELIYIASLMGITDNEGRPIPIEELTNIMYSAIKYL